MQQTTFNILIFFFFKFSEEINLDISHELSAKQMIHMKCCLVFPEKNTKNLECHLLQFCLSALRAKMNSRQ